MHIKSALLGVGATVVVAGGLFFSVAASNAGTVPVSNVSPSPVVVTTSAPAATVAPTSTPEPVVTSATPEPVVATPAPAPAPVVEPAPAVAPTPVAESGPVYAPPATVAPAPQVNGVRPPQVNQANSNTPAGPGITPIAPKK